MTARWGFSSEEDAGRWGVGPSGILVELSPRVVLMCGASAVLISHIPHLMSRLIYEVLGSRIEMEF